VIALQESLLFDPIVNGSMDAGENMASGFCSEEIQQLTEVEREISEPEVVCSRKVSSNESHKEQD
jgi:hypothetical protein